MSKKANQFYALQFGTNISEIKARTQKKNAYIKIEIPEIFAEKLLKQITLKKSSPISRLQLSWIDEEKNIGAEDEEK